MKNNGLANGGKRQADQDKGIVFAMERTVQPVHIWQGRARASRAKELAVVEKLMAGEGILAG